MKKKDKTQVRLEFDGKNAEIFFALKKHLGVQSNAELIRIIVNDRARQLGLKTEGGD
jgi:hypothetical protein